jgi:hypothetical protein
MTVLGVVQQIEPTWIAVSEVARTLSKRISALLPVAAKQIASVSNNSLSSCVGGRADAPRDGRETE